jgi:hypothetical protein
MVSRSRSSPSRKLRGGRPRCQVRAAGTDHWMHEGPPQSMRRAFVSERDRGLEPLPTAWKAVVLPLHQSRECEPSRHNSRAATPAEQHSMRTDIDDRELLAIESATIAVLTATGRVLHGASPERSPGARFALSRSGAGHVVWLRHDVGVATMRPFRGRGSAAAATAGWAALPAIRGLHSFYSTSWSNVSSQRVTERLGLRFIGTRFTIT